MAGELCSNILRLSAHQEADWQDGGAIFPSIHVHLQRSRVTPDRGRDLDQSLDYLRGFDLVNSPEILFSDHLRDPSVSQNSVSYHTGDISTTVMVWWGLGNRNWTVVYSDTHTHHPKLPPTVHFLAISRCHVLSERFRFGLLDAKLGHHQQRWETNVGEIDLPAV